MLDKMARSAIKFHKRQGDSNLEIAQKVGHHKNTVTRVLKQPRKCRFNTLRRVCSKSCSSHSLSPMKRQSEEVWQGANKARLRLAMFLRPS